MTSSASSTQPGDRLTDSPWFWLGLFSMAGLVALLIVGPKYNQRQRIIENKFLAEQERGRQPASESAADGERPAPIHGPADGVLIPLWPLFALTSVLMIVAVVGLTRSRSRANSGEIPHEAPR